MSSIKSAKEIAIRIRKLRNDPIGGVPVSGANRNQTDPTFPTLATLPKDHGLAGLKDTITGSGWGPPMTGESDVKRR